MTAGETPPLAGQAALVTGASRGLGRAIALRLARHGAAQVLTVDGGRLNYIGHP